MEVPAHDLCGGAGRCTRAGDRHIPAEVVCRPRFPGLRWFVCSGYTGAGLQAAYLTNQSLIRNTLSEYRQKYCWKDRACNTDKSRDGRSIPQDIGTGVSLFRLIIVTLVMFAFIAKSGS